MSLYISSTAIGELSANQRANLRNTCIAVAMMARLNAKLLDEQYTLLCKGGGDWDNATTSLFNGTESLHGVATRCEEIVARLDEAAL